MKIGTHVQYGEDGVKGVVVADDDPRIPKAHLPKHPARPEYVYVLYDQPISTVKRYGGEVLGSWFTPDTLREIKSAEVAK